MYDTQGMLVIDRQDIMMAKLAKWLSENNSLQARDYADKNEILNNIMIAKLLSENNSLKACDYTDKNS